MARMPGTRWVGEHGVSKMSAHRRVCVHTIVGNPPAHAAHFSTAADGTIYQSRDTAWQSAANYQGNHDTIAIENDDHGPEYGVWNVNDGRAVPGFTPAQCEAIARIIVFAHQTHGIPIELCPDSRPGSRGVAYHRQGIDGNWAGYAYSGRVSGGEKWSKSGGKVCPGDRRIDQLRGIIIPRARVLAGLDRPTEEDEDEMSNVILVKGDSTVGVPGKNYTWGDLVFMVAFSPQYPDGWARRYMANGPAYNRAREKFGNPVQWPQAHVDQIQFVPGGEPPASVVGQ